MLRVFWIRTEIVPQDADYLSSIEEIIEDARNGKMFILVDDEDRENEGDLIIPAQMATPDAINFMAKYGRGLICLPLTSERVKELKLPLMAQHNDSRHYTPFTVSIEAREGVTTGISASDRSHTVAVAIDPTKQASDIVSPGHIFPLEARPGGTLVRAGHTEAAVDISRLAGLNPSGVICEIMNEDGSMARLPDLIPFSQHHGLKIATIADLIAYRLKNDSIIKRTLETTLDTEFGGEFKMFVYINELAYAEHIALVKGDISGDDPVLVRMHAFNMMEDVLGDNDAGKAYHLHKSMKMIGDADRGVVVLIREPQRTGLSDQVRTKLDPHHQPVAELRDYGVGAQILLDLGVKRMTLITNSKPNVVGLEGYGLEIAGHQLIADIK
jgi:3,4-dihydroxy 2-butanone 4-phosphate synthase / GTP cyclohydrolase II